MTLTKLLKRLALVPFASVTLLGACGSDGVGQTAASDPVPEPALIESSASSSPELVGHRPGEPVEWQLITRPPPPKPTVVTPIVEWVPPGEPECPDAGTPPVQCLRSETLCYGSCVRLDSDPRNCGACGNSCGEGESCHQGRCCD